MDHDFVFALHRWCINYGPLVWLIVASHALIAIAYIGIPLQIMRFMSSQKLHFPNHDIFYFSSAFIVLCGTTHMMAIWTMVISPNYIIEGIALALAGIVSAVTMIRLYPALKYFSGFKELSVYRQANQDLSTQNAVIMLQCEHQSKQLDQLHKLLEHTHEIARAERADLIAAANKNISEICGVIPLLETIVDKSRDRTSRRETKEGG